MASDECVLVKRGAACAVVALDPKSLAFCWDAVQELLAGVAKAAGVRLYVDGSAVFRTLLEPARTAPVSVRFNLLDQDAALGKDGFRIRVSPGALDFEAVTGAGFSNAVYVFLERHCGFRWLWPGPDGEVCDCLEELRVPAGVWVEKPDYEWRHLLLLDMPVERGTTPNAWQIQEFHMRQSEANLSQMKQWLRRNRMGGLKAVAGHTWGRFVSPEEFGRDHPDYFALVNGERRACADNFSGKHGAQLCTSNPAVIDLLVRRVRELFDRYPDVDIVSISPNDGAGFCECEDCIARDVHFGNPPPGQTGAGSAGLTEDLRDDADVAARSRRITGPVTDRIFEYANLVARQIAVSHPGKLLLLLVYGPYRVPPRHVKLDGNVIAQYCVHCHRHWSSEWRRLDYDNLSALSAMAGATGIYEYYEQGIWPGITRSFPDLIAGSVRFFHGRGTRYYSAQASTGFAANGFNLWFLARVLWDTGADVDVLLEDYCRRAFGAAHADMRRYFELWRNRWRDCRGLTALGDAPPGADKGNALKPFEQLLRLYPGDFMADARSAIAAARDAVDPLSPQRRRVDFCALALEGTAIVLEAAGRSYALRDRGWPMTCGEVVPEKLAGLGPPDEVLAQARSVLRCWERWEVFLETHRDDFVFSFFWARYCLDGRKRLHPHYALQKIVEALGSVLEP